MSDLPPLRNRYRATALFHSVLGVVILLFAALTGGSLTKAVVIAVAYVVLATGWSWFRFRQQESRDPKGRP